MGCDEHMYVERWRKTEWIHVNPPQDDFWGQFSKAEPELVTFAHAFIEDPIPTNLNFWHFGRDYRAYGYLAGVRVKTLEFKQPAGFPKDASKKVREEFLSWGQDAHTPTFYTLQELENYTKSISEFPSLRRIRNLVVQMKKTAKNYSLSHDLVRMIVWFDN